MAGALLALPLLVLLSTSAFAQEQPPAWALELIQRQARLEERVGALAERIGAMEGRMATKEDLARLAERMATKEDLARLQERLAGVEGRVEVIANVMYFILGGVLITLIVVTFQGRQERQDRRLREEVEALRRELDVLRTRMEKQ